MKFNNLLPKIAVCGLSLLGLLAATSLPAHGQATHASNDWAQTTTAYDDGDSLRGFLVRLRSDLFLARTNPELQQPWTVNAKVTAESRSGVRHLRIRNFQYLSDGGRSAGEFNLGAGSWPTLVGVLGSAVAEEFLTQAAIKGIPLDQLVVVFTSVPGTAPSTSSGTLVTYPRGLAYTAYIESPATDAQLENLRQTVENTSPVLTLITHHQNIVAHGELSYTQTPPERPTKTLEGLREYLVEKHVASEGVPPAEGRPEAEPRDKDDPPLRAVVRVEGSTGIRNIRTDASNFQFIHDNPHYLAGHNIGPVAEEHLVGVMITCLTHIYEIQASKLQIKLDTLQLENKAVLSSRLGTVDSPPRYTSINYKATISSPESKETIEKLQAAVESICPVYNLLKDSQPISGRVVHGPYTDKYVSKIP